MPESALVLPVALAVTGMDDRKLSRFTGGRVPTPELAPTAVTTSVGATHCSCPTHASMLKQHTIPLEESNIAGLGGADDRELRERAARSEAAYAGAGDSVGVEGVPGCPFHL